MIKRCLFFFLICFATSTLGLPSLVSEAPSSGTVPFILGDNRMFAELVFVRPDCTLRKALAFVDLGTAVPVLTEKLGVLGQGES
jgi:hypothetical protein